MKTLDDIARSLQGYDSQALRMADANTFIDRLVAPVQGIERLPLRQCLGRVLAEDLISNMAVPAHDNSAMDGFAFSGAALAGQATLTLRIAGTALAGKAWAGSLQAGECLKVMTGAILPAGLDTVVPHEMTTVAGDQVHIPADRLRAGDNRRLRGEDLQLGGVALSKGELLAPASIGLAASLGLQTLPVLRRLKVAYMSTGDEVMSPGEPLREGAVFDSNRYTVTSLLERLGCEVIELGVVRDEPIALEAAFRSAAAQADVIISSGGVSVGEADFTKGMMAKLGDVAFWRIAMRPGRPFALGRIGTTVLFGLPGNPVAVMVTFLSLVRPALLKMMGATPKPLPLLQAHSQEPMRKKAGRTEYQRGIVTVAPDGQLQVRTTGNQGSGVLSSMVQANGLIVLGHEQGNVAEGDLVSVMMFDGVI
ncbi:molybdopterin molybdotransferase MoeA [Rhodoferax mekongensis]|uniref:Molybdopterin molybdenumtransferase n=1 Tax=Rhodoferax mekongensis TaxID=3068341 RepID=A0ABZ0B3Z2_9BURK|nr:gephyrin-like molybdotransferase Glp [Rhodoferax sp. TBRC 17307]WNO06365.1 molybdopterin-binding protein [Rhodoferax sp. TBRC 17307]